MYSGVEDQSEQLRVGLDISISLISKRDDVNHEILEIPAENRSYVGEQKLFLEETDNKFSQFLSWPKRRKIRDASYLLTHVGDRDR